MIAQTLKPPTIWQWVGDHVHLILSRTGQHLEYTVIAVLVGLAISLPLAILAYRHARLYPPLTWATGLMYTIPSVALILNVFCPAAGPSSPSG